MDAYWRVHQHSKKSAIKTIPKDLWFPRHSYMDPPRDWSDPDWEELAQGLCSKYGKKIKGELTGEVVRCDTTTSNVEIYCVCRVSYVPPTDKRYKMTECNQCKEWYHGVWEKDTCCRVWKFKEKVVLYCL